MKWDSLDRKFNFIRYVTGTSHHLLGPLAILAGSPEIRKSAVQVDLIR